jgi:transcriptional regulator with XRE-family HTH domain
MKLRGLRQARQRRGLSIGQLAEATGLRRETIAHLEHGQEDPQPYAVRRLEAALGVGAKELVAGPPAPSGASLDELLPSGRVEAASRRPVAAR